MTEMVKVKRVEGRDLLTQEGQEWPSGTVTVEKTQYIRRRLADGDIVEVGAKKSASEPVASTSPKGDK